MDNQEQHVTALARTLRTIDRIASIAYGIGAMCLATPPLVVFGATVFTLPPFAAALAIMGMALVKQVAKGYELDILNKLAKRGQLQLVPIRAVDPPPLSPSPKRRRRSRGTDKRRQLKQ